MKAIVLALSMLVSVGAFAQGGPGHPVVNTVGAWDGTYAPGYSADSGAAANRDADCGARTPCTQPQHAYTGCAEGAKAVVTLPSSTYRGREEVTGTAVFECHDNDWIQIQ